MPTRRPPDYLTFVTHSLTQSKPQPRRTLGQTGLPARTVRQRGSILVVVLGFIILLSFIVVAFVDEAISKIKYYGLFHHREDLRVEAYSALETGLATLNAFAEADDGLVSPDQGWTDPLAFVRYTGEDPNVTVSVTVEDFSGKIPLATAPEEVLNAAFTVLGVDALDGPDYTAAIMDWTDEDDLSRLNSQDGDDYLREDPPYRAANQPIRTWDELRLIAEIREAMFDEETGLPNTLYQQFTSIFTLETVESVNVNTASPTVLAVFQELGWLDVQALQTTLAGLDGVLGTADDAFIRGPGSGVTAENDLIGYEASTVRVSAEARRGEAFFLVETLVSWQGAGSASGLPSSEDVDLDEPEDEDDTDDRAGLGRRREEQPTTVATEASALGYPFQILRLRENRKL